MVDLQNIEVQAELEQVLEAYENDCKAFQDCVGC